MSDFKKLHVWQKAQVLMLDARRAAHGIRGADNASLRNQLIRAADSIPTNIVEGSVQESRKQFARFIRIAVGSSGELEQHLRTSRELKLIPLATSVTLLDQNVEVQKMLYGLLRYLKRPKNAGAPAGSVP